MYGYWGGGPPPINVYPPQYPYPPPQPPPSKSDIKEYLQFARAYANRNKEKNKKDEKKDEKKTIITRQFSLVEVLFYLILLGPVVGPIFNHLQERLVHYLAN